MLYVYLRKGKISVFVNESQTEKPTRSKSDNPVQTPNNPVYFFFFPVLLFLDFLCCLYYFDGVFVWYPKGQSSIRLKLTSKTKLKMIMRQYLTVT